MRQGGLALLVGAAMGWTACSRQPAPPVAGSPVGAPARAAVTEEIGESDLRLVLDLERALRERGIEADRLRRARALRLTSAGLPGDLPADREVQAQVDGAARDQGEDAERYVRARRRLDQVLLARRQRGLSEATQRFREAHLESLRRARALATSEAERERLDAIVAEVESGAARESAALEAARAFASDAELRLVEAHAAELGLPPLPTAADSLPSPSPAPTADDDQGVPRPADAEPDDTLPAVSPGGAG